MSYLELKYGIPKWTIDNKAKDIHGKSYGRQCVLSVEEERILTENIILAI